MTNKDLMRLLAKININHQQKKVIYILSVTLAISICGVLYYRLKSKQLTLSLDAEKEETDRLNFKLFDSNKIRSRQQKEIHKLESDIAQLQIQLKEENKSR